MFEGVGVVEHGEVDPSLPCPDGVKKLPAILQETFVLHRLWVRVSIGATRENEVPSVHPPLHDSRAALQSSISRTMLPTRYKTRGGYPYASSDSTSIGEHAGMCLSR